MDKLKQAVRVLEFRLEGRFIGFVSDFEEKPKRIRVATAEGEYWIKLSKELRSTIGEVLEPGAWVQISGEQKLKYKTGELKLKAFQVSVMAPTNQESACPPPATAPQTKACVMVCQKSSCCKRGAGEVVRAVTESLRDRGLEDQVTIKGTGCMKQCKSGPCMVFLPDKARYSGVAPKEIPKLIEKHFAAKLKPEMSESKLSLVTSH